MLTIAWAVGMGNDKMADTLMFILYADSTGKNITLSPRQTSGNVEPTYTKDIEVHVLAESGIFNGIIKANAMCKNCRSWGKHSINQNDTAAKFIYSSGSGSLKSNSLSAGLRQHSSHGSFTMDLTKAYGKAGVPTTTSDTSGTVQTSEKSDRDVAPALHAFAMILAFVGLMPLGVVILRILNSPKWHGFNQAISALVALIGMALGVYIGTLYNRVSLPNFAVLHSTNNFEEQRLYISSSDIWDHHYCNDDCSVHAWIPTSQNLHADVGSYQTYPYSHMAGTPNNPVWYCKWLPVREP
jgi:hypothetical protein